MGRRVALNAGVDQDLCVSSYPKGLPQALAQGLVDNTTLDFATSNILRQKFAAGLFEGSWRIDSETIAGKLDTFRPLALAAARQGTPLYPTLAAARQGTPLYPTLALQCFEFSTMFPFELN